MNEFLVLQVLVMDQYPEINLTPIIRRVIAVSRAEAVGKFIENTKHIKAVQRLTPSAMYIQDITAIN